MNKKQHLTPKQIKFWFSVFQYLPIKRNKVVFCNYVGKPYGCNPKYIANELIKRQGNWDLVWMTDFVDAPFPGEIRVVPYESIRSIYELATAGVWIDNQRKLPHYKKRKQQYFIETWHGGGGPMKMIGADNPRNYGNKPYEETSKHMDRITNLMISNSKCITKIYRSAFLYTGEIYESGYPRNDILVKDWEQFRSKVYEHFHLPMERNTILYAPTYRNSRDFEQYKIDIRRIKETCAKRFGGQWSVIIRLHPTMQQKASELYYEEEIINGSSYDDMQELLAGCDILISDYSSVISEFALTGKPIFLFATDKKEYAMERDFYWDYNSLPFPIAENNEELIGAILTFDPIRYKDCVGEYLKDVGMCETGHASASIVDRIESWRYQNRGKR